MRYKAFLTCALATAVAVLGSSATASAHTGRFVFVYTPAGSVQTGTSPDDNGCGYLAVGGAPMVCLDGTERTAAVTITAPTGAAAEGIWSTRLPDGSEPGGIVCGSATVALPAGASEVVVGVGGDPAWCGWTGPSPALTPTTETGSTVVITLS